MLQSLADKRPEGCVVIIKESRYCFSHELQPFEEAFLSSNKSWMRSFLIEEYMREDRKDRKINQCQHLHEVNSGLLS